MKNKFFSCCLIFVCALVGVGSSPAAPPLVLDGKLEDPFWESVPVQNLSPSEEGVPESGGTVRVKQHGRYLCFAMHLPEPGGKVLARSMGRNPIWQKDATNAPAVEDRVIYALRYRSAGGALRDLSVSINPWQAYRVEESGEVVPSAEILRATDVNSEGWTVEAAVPAELIDADWASEPALGLRVERIRSRRALAPEHRWAWPGGEAFSKVTVDAPQGKLAEGDVPEVRAPVFGNADPPLEIGRVVRVPSVVADWEDPAWSEVPIVPLTRNEPLPRDPTYETRVKWMHDGNNLAFFFYAEEPEPVVAGSGGRDGSIGGDDRISIYLATSGSRFLEISVNSAGAILDSLGGGPRLRRPDYSWNGDFEVETAIRRGSWIARLNIPLAQCSSALGETDIPDEWRVLIARHRVARRGEVAEVSTLPALEGSSSFVGPARYRRMILSAENPASVKMPRPADEQVPVTGLAATLTNLPSNVWSRFDRQHLGVRRMVERDLQRRLEDVTLAERRAWEKVETREDWESFRDKRMEALRNSLGEFPPQRPPLDVRVSARHGGKGYQLENVVFQSRPGYYVTANLYVPEGPRRQVPGIVIVHSQHAPKAEWELHDSAEVWARAGNAVLIMERPGYGERTETNPWYRQGYGSRFTFTKQLYLVGESYSAWSAWDVMRSVDFLLQRPEVDAKRIILIGAVAGGGAVAGLAASLDPRVAAVIPYNFDQGHLRVHGDLRGQIAEQFSPWLISASIAPRKFVRAFEFAWEGSEETDVPSLWVDGMARSEKVWGFYNARDSVVEIQGFGLLRDQRDRRSPCRNLGPEQREGIYPVLERWFGIPKPSPEDCAILPNSELSTNVDREASRRQEAERLRPVSDLLSIPPKLSATLSRKALHQVAFDMGTRMLRDARAKREGLAPKERAQQLREELRSMLGDVEPTTAPNVDRHWNRSLANVQVEALSLTVEEGIYVPVLLLLPQGTPLRSVVVAVASGGKDRFLKNNPDQLATLLEAGIGVCLPDVRGTGETSFSAKEYPYGGVVQQHVDLSRNLLGSRLKDLRTVLHWLRSHEDLRGAKVAVWGESFALPNPENLYLDELEYEAGPQIQRQADPLGAHLALLAGLYEEDVQSVLARGGLYAYLSVLENAYAYVPPEVIVSGILKSGDIADIVGALAPRPVALSNLVGARNVRVTGTELESVVTTARPSYEKENAVDRLAIQGDIQDPAAWLIENSR